VTLGKTLTLEQGLQVKQQWWLGRVESMPASAIQVFPQLLTPNPAVIGDARFRRALLYALDREAIGDSLMFGLSSVVHSYLAPSEPPEFQSVADRIVRYPYDPKRAEELLTGMGLVRGANGTFADVGGQRLSVEIRTITSDVNQQAMLTVADYWQRAGIGAETFVIPRQQAQDPAYRAEFPGVELVRNSADCDGLKRHPSAQTPLAENGYRGTNRTRYINPEFDALLNRYFTTIPIRERAEAFDDVIHHMTDQAIVLGLFYDMDSTVIADRLVNVGPRQLGSTQARNTEQWDVR
jgi:peptide/nickel transport system substrate-binding protein